MSNSIAWMWNLSGFGLNSEDFLPNTLFFSKAKKASIHKFSKTAKAIDLEEIASEKKN